MHGTASEAPARRGRIPWGLLGMLGLVLATETMLARNEIDLTSDPWRWDWHASNRWAGLEVVGCDVLCFGDSLVKHAVMPRVIEERTGQRTFNLALGGSMAPASFFQLRHALASGARPKAILVDFWPDMLTYDPIVNPRIFSQVGSLRDCLDLGWTAGDGRLFGMVTAGRILTSVRCREEIRAGILAALRGESSSKRDEVIPYLRNWQANKGGMVSPRNPIFVDEVRGELENLDNPGAAERWRTAIYPDAWQTDPVNREYMIRFFELAAAHDIPVLYLLTPIHPVVQERREQIGIDKAHTRFARAMKSRFPNVTVVDARYSDYSGRVFVDFIHLDRHGSFAFSVALADILRRFNAGGADLPGWVHLPAYRDRPDDIEIEDLDRSRLVAKDPGAVVVR